MFRSHSGALLDSIITMDEFTVSFHMPEARQQSKQWMKKGQQKGECPFYCGVSSEYQ
jgi:hypothetical protein